jgi:transposase
MYEFYNGFMKIAKGRNGVRYSEAIREKARELRMAGRTHREITKELGISLGTANTWVKDVVLSIRQQRDVQVRRHQHVWTLEDRERARQRLKTFWLAIKYTREDLLERITDFYAQNGRIPLKRNMFF